MQPGPPRRLPGRLDAVGIELDDELVWYGDFYHESGFDGGNALLDLADRPTAIFAASDQMAFGVYEAVRRRGLRVPDDVSVVGFDDLPEVVVLAAAHDGPPAAVRDGCARRPTLLRIAAGETLESPRLELATTLIVRSSTAPVRSPSRARRR